MVVNDKKTENSHTNVDFYQKKVGILLTYMSSKSLPTFIPF